MLPLSQKDLERKWVWKDHDEEGIRFAFFVTLQELRELAVTLARLRSNPTAAQLILSQYHAAFLDLQHTVQIDKTLVAIGQASTENFCCARRSRGQADRCTKHG
jgi:hypothetical protein